MELSLLTVCYLIGSLTFIIGLKMLSHPDSARKGNLVAAVGMAIAIFGTIFLYEEEGKKLGNYSWIFGGLILGTIVGVLAAKKVKMTAMPEIVSLFNGMGGACAALISVNEFGHISEMLNFSVENIPGWHTTIMPPSMAGTLITIFLGLIIGAVSFA